MTARTTKTVPKRSSGAKSKTTKARAKAKAKAKSKTSKPRKTRATKVPAKIGRPSKYTETIGQKVCELIANVDHNETGSEYRVMSMVEAASRVKVDPRTVYRWLDEHSSFRREYARARRMRSEGMLAVVALILKNLDACEDHVQIAAAKLRCDTLRWFAAKYNAAEYGDRLQVEATVETREAAPEYDWSRLDKGELRTVRELLGKARVLGEGDE